jgi:glucosylglycerate synthase
MPDNSDQTLLPQDVLADIERTGTADLAIGLATFGTSQGIDEKAAAIRAGLDAHFSGHPAVLIHLDHGPSDETSALLSDALGDRRVLRVRSPHAMEPLEGGVDRSETFHTVLAAGRALGARVIMMLNSDLSSMTPDWIRGLAEPVLKEEYGLVLPLYQRNRYEGTLTHTLVAPLIRALFGQQLVHPLAEEFGCSATAADFLLKQDVWSTDLGHQGCELFLPVAIIEHRLPLGQAVLGQRAVARPARPAPLGATVGRVTAALFALAERFEATWLEVRGSEPVPTFGAPREPLETGFAVDANGMLHGFSQGVRDLLPIWERILAPDNLGDVLALAEPGTGPFSFPDRLWARIVYDFLLAYRMRVVYRSHVAQSLAPLYLGRAAALVLETRNAPAAAVTLAAERLAAMFEAEKPYLVDRWR